MTKVDIARAYDELGGVNVFRVLILENEPPNLKACKEGFLAATEKYKDFLLFKVDGYPEPKPALEYLRKLKRERRNIHLLLVDHKLRERSYTGVAFVREALEIFPDVLFAFSTAFLRDAWGECGETPTSDVREKILDQQLYPHKKGEGDYRPQIEHFLAKYRALILERKRQPARSIIITSRDTLTRENLKFKTGNAWFVSPVKQSEADQEGQWFSDDEFPRFGAGPESPLVIFTVKSQSVVPSSAGLKSADAAEGIMRTYFARQHFRSFYFLEEKEFSEREFPPPHFGTLTATNANTYASCFNMNLIYLSKRRRGYRPVVMKNKEYEPGGEKEYELAERVDGLHIEQHTGKDFPGRFNALAHVYQHFNAEAFFLNEKGEFAKPGTIKRMADKTPETAEGVLPGLSMADSVQVFVDDGTNLVPVCPLQSGPSLAHEGGERNAGPQEAPDAGEKSSILYPSAQPSNGQVPDDDIERLYEVQVQHAEGAAPTKKRRGISRSGKRAASSRNRRVSAPTKKRRGDSRGKRRR